MHIEPRDLMAPDTEPTDEELALVMREARDLAVQRRAKADAWVAARVERSIDFRSGEYASTSDRQVAMTAELATHPRLLVVAGPNGAGKTTSWHPQGAGAARATLYHARQVSQELLADDSLWADADIPCSPYVQKWLERQ
jgi:hypothetical protein